MSICISCPSHSQHVIKKTNRLLKELEQRYPRIQSNHKLKEYYSTEQMVFFDCDTEPETCLKQTLQDQHPPAFRVFYVTQDKTDETYELAATSYSNFPESSIEKWIPRYHNQLKLGGEAGLEASGKKYVEYIGAEIRD